MPMFQDISQMIGIHWKTCHPTSGNDKSRGTNAGMLLVGLKCLQSFPIPTTCQHAGPQNLPTPTQPLQPFQPFPHPPSQPTSPATSHGPGVPRSTLPAEHRAPPAIRPGHASAHFASRAWNPADSGSKWRIGSKFLSVSVD